MKVRRKSLNHKHNGERVQFTTAEGPHGLTVSPTLAGRKVAAILRHYLPS